LVDVRKRLLASLKRRISDERVVDAIASVPREQFVPADLRASAYEDRALPIGAGQTISQPTMVALMLEAAQIQPTDRVLEVGTGSGYQAAVLAHLAERVISVERVESLAAGAVAALNAMSVSNVEVHVVGSELGWPADAPYDVLVVAAAAAHVPRALIEQLAPGGRLLLPVGDKRSQVLTRLTNSTSGDGLMTEGLGRCAFVPLVGSDASPR
jgi:protein-L-isoaspartate(D-aspartate) O-methyltransferase